MNISWSNDNIFPFLVSFLTRMAANNEQFLTKVLGIKDPKHRSKITIKAMDVVLFGPPKGQFGKCMVILLFPFSNCIRYFNLFREDWFVCHDCYALQSSQRLADHLICPLVFSDWKSCVFKYVGKPCIVKWTKERYLLSMQE